MNNLSKESNLFSSCSRRSWYLRFVYDRKPAARASAPGSSPSSSEPHQIQVLAAVIVPKRKRKPTQQPKLSFGFESTSRGPDNKRSNMETDLLELLVHFRTQQESQHGKLQSTEARNGSQELYSKCDSKAKNTTTSRTMSSRECKPLSAGTSNISSSKLAEGDDEAFDHDTRKPKLTKQGAIDIITQLRDFLRENGPSEEHDLRKALSISEVQMILDMDGTITAFLGRSPLFEVIYEDLYTFVYYNSADDEDDHLAETFAKFLTDSILQDGSADDCVRQETGVLSSDSSVGVSAGGGEDNEPAACRRKNASSQISSLRLHHSRALQVMQQTCDAKVETQRCQTAQITELKPGLQKRDAKITQLKQRRNPIPESQAPKQQIHGKILAVGRTSTPPDLGPPRTAAKDNNVSTSKKDWKSRSTLEPGAQACLREPKPRKFSNPSPQHQPKAEQKQLVLPVRQLPSFMSLIRGISPPRHRKMFEKKDGFPNAPRSRPRHTPRRSHPPLQLKTEKNLAPPIQTTPQPAYPRRRSTRSNAEERPYSIRIGQNTLLKPQERPQSPPQSRQKTRKKSWPFPAIPRPQPAPTRRRRLPPLPFMAGEKPRGPPITSTTQPFSSCHQDLPAPRSKAEKKQRALPVASTSFPVPPLHRGSPTHRTKVEERPFSTSTHQKSPLKLQPHRRSPSTSRQKTQENIHTFPVEQSPRPAPTRRQTPLSLPHKTEAKPRAQPIRSTSRRLFPSHRESPVSRPKDEEKQRSIPISPNPWRIPSRDKILTKSSQQHPMPACHGRTGQEKQLPAARRDVESRQSSKSAPAEQSKPEDKLSRLVRMVKTRKPEYTERDIRSHMDRLRHSLGGFSHKTSTP
ncbi:hypothetical protein HPB51_008419 [Rhipicephalus microplus]|uniref:Uncharacterized protein n=1 Tax=Rhipicephalus microplus TaxID=6941 RepID=A0A9J6EFM0_RHIMP|nr:hypothetical protein HPB51_008419 [Rhipicephalus microplus]